MKRMVASFMPLFVAVICQAAVVVLTSDPLTQLPLDPASNSRLNLGNAPTPMHPSTVCKSKMQANLYTVYEGVSETTAWYAAHLKSFKHTHGYSGGRSREVFYNADGTLVISVLGEPGPDGRNVDTHSVMYYSFQPGLSEKTILAMLNEKIVCP
jgi:hypothetical protein